MLGRLNVASEQELTTDKFMTTTKPVLSRWLDRAYRIMCEQHDMAEKMKETVEQMKTEALADKTEIVRLQADLLENKKELGTAKIPAVYSTIYCSNYSATGDKDLQRSSARQWQ